MSYSDKSLPLKKSKYFLFLNNSINPFKESLWVSWFSIFNLSTENFKSCSAVFNSSSFSFKEYNSFDLYSVSVLILFSKLLFSFCKVVISFSKPDLILSNSSSFVLLRFSNSCFNKSSLSCFWSKSCWISSFLVNDFSRLFLRSNSSFCNLSISLFILLISGITRASSLFEIITFSVFFSIWATLLLLEIYLLISFILVVLFRVSNKFSICCLSKFSELLLNIDLNSLIILLSSLKPRLCWSSSLLNEGRCILRLISFAVNSI